MPRLAYLIFLILFSTNILADDYPNIEGSYDIKLQTDRINSYKDSNPLTNDSDLKATDTYIEVRPHFVFNLKDYIALETSWILLNIKSSDRVGADRVFDDEGLALEELFLRFRSSDAEFSLGKLNPDFGSAWKGKVKSGIWGSDYGDEYQIVGKLGLEVKAKFDMEDYGNHVVSFNTFFSDDTGLEKSTITRRDATADGKGQAGNSGGFSSYTLSIAGENFYNIEGMFYELSYRSLDAGTSIANISDEEGYSLGVGLEREVLNNLKITPFVEYAVINNFNSINNRFGPEFGDDDLPGDYKYLSMMLSIDYNNWGLHINRLEKDYDYNIKSGANQSEYSVSYKFKNGVSLSVGRKDEEDSSANEISTVGAMLHLNRTF